MRPIPAPLELYRHFKGNLYQIRCIAKHSETGESMVVYQAMYGDFMIYVRPLEMFMKEVDHDKYPDVKQKYRFEKVDGSTEDEKHSDPDPAATEKNTSDRPLKEETTGGGNDVPEGYVDPRVIEFLDSRTYEEKLTILAGMKERLTDDMLDIMAAAEDIEVKPGSVEDRYEELKNCLITLERFECNRLR